jgi:hypothetical protein
MNGFILSAAFLSFLMGTLHSILGEKLVLAPLLRLGDLPPVLGSALFTRRILRFAWHLTTALLWGLGGLLLYWAPGTGPESHPLLAIVAATYLACSLIAGIITRGKHFSWVVFLAMAGLVLLGAR